MPSPCYVPAFFVTGCEIPVWDERQAEVEKILRPRTEIICSAYIVGVGHIWITYAFKPTEKQKQLTPASPPPRIRGPPRLDFSQKIQESGVNFERVLEKRLCAQQKERKHSLSVCNGSGGNHLGGLHTGEPRQDYGGFSRPQGDLGRNLPGAILPAQGADSPGAAAL